MLVMAMGFVVARAQQWDNYRSLLADQTVQIDETNLPIIFIDVSGNTIQKNNYILGRMKIIHNGDGQLNYGDTIAHPNQNVDYEGWIAIKYRGNSSFSNSDKKPYQIRTLKEDLLPDEGGEKQKVSLLGMGKDNKWMFIAPWGDKVMFRDILSFELARPWMDFVPTVKLCEVFLDGVYYGVFGFGERVSKGKQRLNLHDPGEDGDDLTGDFHVEVDRPEGSFYASRYYPWRNMQGDEKRNFTIYYQHKEPEQDDWASLPSGTRTQINRLIDQMESAFVSEDYANPEGGYRQHINELSMIDYMLSTEVANNIDNYRLSTHFYKYSNTRAENEGLDPRWKMAIWDYNLGWGNADYNRGNQTDAWVWQLNTYSDDAYQVPFYWYQAMNDGLYVEHLRQRWQQYREGNHSDTRLMATIDSLANMLTSHGAVERNQQAWNIIGRYGWPNAYVGRTYEEDLNYMKQWARARLRFLDDNWLPREPRNTAPILPNNGWNADVVVENLPASEYANATIDANRTFYAQRLKEEGSLPTNRIVASVAEDITYRLAAYNAANAVSFHEQGQTATLDFDPFATSDLWMLATAGGGMATLEVVVEYTDGTQSNPETVSVRDFSVPVPDGSEAVTGLGNINIDTDQFNSGTCHSGMFDLRVRLDKTKYVRSVTLTNRSSAFPTVLAFAYQVVPAPTDVQQVVDHAPKTHTTEALFDLQGRQLSAPQKGLNIIRTADGKVRKIWMK